MAAQDNCRVLLLEEEIRSLSAELVQCQADKEFVWSLWKRLQVANPDLTQAVSLVVEREKQKAESKDRKVLQILQIKDCKIQELEQKVTCQQQEMNNLVQGKMAADEETGKVTKGLAALRQKLKDKSQELKKLKEEVKEQQIAVRSLEEAKEGLGARCSNLLGDLETLQREATLWAREKFCMESAAKVLENEVNEAKRQAEDVRKKGHSLAAQLSSREEELAKKAEHITKLGQELQEVRALYQQSTEHVSEQAQLIRQLEGLNTDAQKVLRNQEAAHAADAVSYQQLYRELSMCYEALKSNEAQLQQSHTSLTTQLCQKEQLIFQLQARLQQTPTANCSQTRQTNSRHFQEQQAESRGELDPPVVKESPVVWDPPAVEEVPVSRAPPAEEGSPVVWDPPAIDPSVRTQETRPRPARRQDAPVQRSRSLSPGGTSSGGPARGASRAGGAERRIRHLEELLKLKTKENEELRKVHDKRYERLRLIQTNLRTAQVQLLETEEAQGRPRARSLRAEPWQLRQEDSDAVWNELAHFRRQNDKLLSEKTNLEEELDVLRVQSAMDRATVYELQLCLQQEHQELLLKVGEDTEVKSSTPKKPSSGRVEQSLKKIDQLEMKMRAMEKETRRLRGTNQELIQARDELQATLQAREEAVRTRARAERGRLEAVVQELEGQVADSRRREAAARRELVMSGRRVLRLRQDLGILRAARGFRRRGVAPAAVGKARLRGPLRQHRAAPRSCGGRVPENLNKDDWEDWSGDSQSEEEYSDSLDSHPPLRTALPRASLPPRRWPRPMQLDRRALAYPAKAHREDLGWARPDAKEEGGKQQQQQQQQQQPWRRRQRRRRPTSAQRRVPQSVLQQRITSLQQQIAVLQTGKKAAQRVAWELRETNKKITSQLNSLTQRFHISKQVSQKLTCDVAGLEQQRELLQRELGQLRQNQNPELPSAIQTPGQEPLGAALKNLELEKKLLQTKLKSSSNEVAKLASASRALKVDLQEKEERLKELHDKVSHMERDVNMKRQLAEDLKTRMKIFQDNDKTHKGLIEDLEKKVKALSEEATNRKAYIDSLKRRLSVATREKNQHELSGQKLRDSLDKKEQKVAALQLRVEESERSMAALEETASRHMHGLAEQSAQALEGVQRRLERANLQLEQLTTFVKVLVGEIHKDVQDAKSQLRRGLRKKRLEAGRLSKQSLIRAQSLAASILNLSQVDLEDMLDTDEDTEEAQADMKNDRDWLDQVMKILQQQIPSAALLMEAMLAKMKERKVLTEELAELRREVSGKV